MTRTFVCVMSVGRSGSSAVAGMLHMGGIPMYGKNPIGPNEFNPKGHFEDHEWHKLNRVVANHFDSRFEIKNETLDKYSFRDFLDLTDEKILQLYSNLIQRSQKDPIWGRKCTMFGYIWSHIYKLFNDTVKIIYVTRNMEAIIQSRKEHSNISTVETVDLIKTLRNKMFETLITLNTEVLQLRYDKIITHPYLAATRIEEFLEWDKFDTGAAAAHIDSTLQHYR